MRKKEKVCKMEYTTMVTEIKCDVCKKVIPPKSTIWYLTTHHHDWGNDSIDSFEYFDLCSKECVDKKYEEYFKECESSDTKCFELEQEYIDY